MIVSRHRVRLALEPSDPDTVVNKFTSGQVIIYRARAVQFEVALFYGGVLQNVDNFASFTAEVKTLTAGVVDVGNAPVMTKTINAVDLNNALTKPDWDADSAQHGTIPFEVAETGLDMAGHANNRKTFQLIITGVTTDGVAKRLTLANIPIVVVNDGGVTSANSPAVGDPLYLNANETLAAVNGRLKVVTDPGGSFTLVNEDGYGIRFSATRGPVPELKLDIINP